MKNRALQRHLLLFGLVLVIAGSYVFAAAFAQAQVQFSNIAGAGIDFRPMYPKPGEEVMATFRSTYVDLSSSELTWTVDGEVVQQGYGARTYKFTAGEIGSRLVVKVTAVDPHNKGVTATEVLTVGDVSFAWEGNTYTPPFFKGRALHSPGSSVTILALPTILSKNGSVIDASDLVFEWEFDDSKPQVAGGRGLDTVTFQSNNPFRDFGIELEVKDLSGETRNISRFTIPQATPRVVFYENNALLGMRYAHPLTGSYTMEGDELALVAEPFYTSVKNRLDENLVYEWQIDSQELDAPGTIRLRPEGTGAGSASISLNVLNEKFIGQRLQERLQVQYNTEQNDRSRFTPQTTAL